MTPHALVMITVGLALITCTASAAAPKPADDTTGDDGRFTVQGPRVEGRPTLEGAPRLGAGQYVDTVPPEGAEKYYLLTRKHRGSALHVGVSGRPAGDSPDDSSLVVRLRTLGNGHCGYVETYDNDSQVQRRNSVLSGATVSWSPDAGLRARCLNNDELVLRISGAGNSRAFAGRPFEITVTEEPRLAGGESRLPPPAKEPTSWRRPPHTATPGDGVRAVAGGLSFNTATDLRPGSYRADIAPGEARFFRVPLNWGRHLQAHVDIAHLPAGLRKSLDELEQTMTLRLFGPSRGTAGTVSRTAPASVGDVISFDRRIRLASLTLPVRYRNREGETERQRAAALAGGYYVMVSLSQDKQGQRYRVPFELRVDVLGEPSGAPFYVTGQQVAGPGASALAMSGDELVPLPQEEEPEAGLATFLASVGLALLLFGAVTLSTTRVREVTGKELADRDSGGGTT